MTYVEEWHLYQALVECQELLADELTQAATTLRFRLGDADSIHTDQVREIIEGLRAEMQAELRSSSVWRVYEHLHAALESMALEHLGDLLADPENSPKKDYAG